jgi:signal transduction histidine kinase
VVWAPLTGSVLTGAGGEPLYGIGQIQDITERKRAEQSQRFLSEASARLASSLDLPITLATLAQLSVPGLADWCEIDLLDAEGHCRVANSAAVDAAREHLLLALFAGYPEASERYGTSIAAALRSGAPILLPVVTDEMIASWAADDRHRELLQGLAPRSLMVLPLFVRERTLGTIVLASGQAHRRFDTRDLELATELGRRAAMAVDNAHLYQAAEHAIQVRDEVLRIVAHDLRAPITGISLSAQLLRRRVGAGEQERVASILRGVEQANRLIQDLLDVARMEAGQLVVARRREVAGPLVRECTEAHRGLAEARSLSVQVEMSDDLPPIDADRSRFLQILSNLLGNAIKFTPVGGRVTVRVEPQGEMVRFSVHDTGPGIAPEDLSHVFESFWQARKGGREGAGLGLAIARGLVEAHGGRIWVESTPGRGSAFYFTLPVAVEASASVA